MPKDTESSSSWTSCVSNNFKWLLVHVIWNIWFLVLLWVFISQWFSDSVQSVFLSCDIFGGLEITLCISASILFTTKLPITVRWSVSIDNSIFFFKFEYLIYFMLCSISHVFHRVNVRDKKINNFADLEFRRKAFNPPF